jgi:hypothetical protein
MNDDFGLLVRNCDGPACRPDEYAEQMVEFFDIAFGTQK